MAQPFRFLAALLLALSLVSYLTEEPTSFRQGKPGIAFAKDGGGDGGGGVGDQGGDSHGSGSAGGRDKGKGSDGGRGGTGGNRGADVAGGGASGQGGDRGYGGKTGARMGTENPVRERKSRVREAEAEDRETGSHVLAVTPR